jgi:small multidrug resistance pump
VKWLLLFLAIGTNAFASIFVKMSVTPPRSFPALGDPWAALGNWPFWMGLALFGATFLLYAAALAALPLNVAYPVLTTGAVAVVAVMSVLLFDEQYDWTTIVGTLLAVTGVSLIMARAS